MTKIDIISGFLGAGKTTLIKKLLKEAFAGEKVVLIENEFGEIGVDGGFLKEAGIEIKEMNSGCICCSLVGDFGTSLKEVLETYHPERIIIEPSGVGKLSDVAAAVENVKFEEEVKVNSAVAVVDATKCKMYIKNFGEFFVNQIQHAGTVILSRTQKLSEEKLKKAVELIREQNQTATIITTEWDQLEGSTILAHMEKTSTMEEELLKDAIKAAHEHHHEEGCGCGHDHHDHHGHHHHHADEVFGSWGIETTHKYTVEEIENALAALNDEEKYGTILRAKGIVAGADGSWIHFDYVPEETSVRTGSAMVIGRLCVIGAHIKEEAIKELFA